jgi:DHA1 family bicyclomycin/chloramphenicol resistance-like MFS transporter
MTALGAVAGDIYLPSLPQIAADFATTEGGAQATVSFTMLGGAIGQLLIGPISDMVGRRRPVLAGVALLIAASVGIMLAPSLWVLLLLRLIQGVGNAAAAVVALAVVRDLYTGTRAARLISRLMLVIGAAPLLAPTLGSLIGAWAGWRATFAFLAAFGVWLWLFVYFKLPDTLAPERRGARSVRSLTRGYAGLGRDRTFVALAVVPGLGQAALMAWVVSSPFLVMETYGLSPAIFPIVFAAGGICLVGGAQVNAGLVRRLGPRRLLAFAIPASLVCAAVLLLLTLLGRLGGLTGVLIPTFAILLLSGMVGPNASAMAMSRHGEAAGSAAAVVGFGQASIAAVMTAVVGVIGGQFGAAAIVFGAIGLAQAIVVAGAKIYGPQPPTPLP